MRSKLLIAAGLLVAFVLGTVSSNLLSGTASAFQKTDQAMVPTPVASASTSSVAPRTVRTNYVAPRSVAPRAVTVANPVQNRAAKKRSWQKEALIVGGGAGAGAAIGAVAGGGKGAAVGAISGGVAGLVYDLITRNKS